MTVIVASTRHRLAWHEADPRIGHMRCGLRVALTGQPCPAGHLHLVAMPTCPEHAPLTDCAGCVA